MAIEYVTAGESHGRMLVGIISNIPAGLEIDEEYIDAKLKLRMKGYGRGERMKIECDRAFVVSGVYGGKSTGAPIAVLIENADHLNCAGAEMGEKTDRKRSITAVRPGHADLSGVVKYGFNDACITAERASARTTAMTVALGAIAELYLARLGISVSSRTVAIGGVCAENGDADGNCELDNDLRCADGRAAEKMKVRISDAVHRGDTLGGVAEITVSGCKSGIGSYVSADKRLDGIIMRAVGAVNSVKAVEIGDGVAGARVCGSEFHDRIYAAEKNKAARKTNRAGGIEGGMSNGESIVVRAYFKPIPTLKNGLDTVDIVTGEECVGTAVRGDSCAVPAGGVVCEAVIALALAAALSDMLGGDTMDETEQRYNNKRSAV